MTTHLDQGLQQDLDLIRNKVLEMSGKVEVALRDSVEALEQHNRSTAYAVILRDRFIDALENELDELCQKFLLKRQPVAGHLRFAYGVIKMNNELERLGDYAKSIARHFLAVSCLSPVPPMDQIVGMGRMAMGVLRNAIEAFAEQDAELARATRAKEKSRQIDNLRTRINQDLVRLNENGDLPANALPPLMVIANRFERVADQAGNICEEVVYMCTGLEVKHQEEALLRILFVDTHDSCRAQMAEGIGKSLGLDDVSFASAGVSPRPVDERTVEFMRSKGIDISGQRSRYLGQILDLEEYTVIISIGERVEDLSLPPCNTVHLAWDIRDPSSVQGSESEVQAAYERVFKYLSTHIHDLVQAVFGETTAKEMAQ